MLERSFIRKCKICCAILVFAAAMVVGADSLSERDAVVTLYKFAPTDEYGIYRYAFSTSNDIDVQEAGSSIETIGMYSYTSPEGIIIEVRYIADELGFHAVGNQIPVPPRIPEFILRSLEYIRTHPNQEDRGRDRVWK